MCAVVILYTQDNSHYMCPYRAMPGCICVPVCLCVYLRDMQDYSHYKYYGFAGKGAKSSWGYNPRCAETWRATKPARATGTVSTARQPGQPLSAAEAKLVLKYGCVITHHTHDCPSTMQSARAGAELVLKYGCVITQPSILSTIAKRGTHVLWSTAKRREQATVPHVAAKGSMHGYKGADRMSLGAQQSAESEPTQAQSRTRQYAWS